MRNLVNRPGITVIFSTTLILSFAVILHSLRIMVLSLVLDDKDFGIVSTILLITTIFSDIGCLGLSQIICNQVPYKQGSVNRRTLHIATFIQLSFIVSFVFCTVFSIIATLFSGFSFILLFITLFSSSINLVILSSFRNSQNKYTYPIAYSVKAVIVMTDIAILSSGNLKLSSVALWGEVFSLPVLIITALYLGVLRFDRRISKRIWKQFTLHYKNGISAICSTGSAMLFFNAERIFASLFLNLEAMGLITKLVIPKIIASQGSFLIAVHFHRYITGLGMQEKKQVLQKIRSLQVIVLGLMLLSILIAGLILSELYKLIYEIDISLLLSAAIAVSSIIFLFNPFSIILKASSKFGILLLNDIIAFIIFCVAAFFLFQDARSLILASSLATVVYLVLTRRSAYRMVNSKTQK